VETLARQRFVSLTTVKRNGERVPTPMWIGRDGAHLFVWTHGDGVVPVSGSAEIVADPATVRRLEGLIRRKYGVEYRIVTTVERLLARGRKPRVILRISLAD
jgi:hypothetical protein